MLLYLSLCQACNSNDNHFGNPIVSTANKEVLACTKGHQESHLLMRNCSVESIFPQHILSVCIVLHKTQCPKNVRTTKNCTLYHPCNSIKGFTTNFWGSKLIEVNPLYSLIYYFRTKSCLIGGEYQISVPCSLPKSMQCMTSVTMRKCMVMVIKG